METLNRLPWAAKHSVFERLAQIADVSSMSRQEREQYDVALKRYRDTYAVIDGAEDRGREEERAANIRSMFDNGITIEKIAKIIKISVEQVKKIPPLIGCGTNALHAQHPVLSGSNKNISSSKP